MVFPQFLKSVQLVTTESVQMKGVDVEKREGGKKGGRHQQERDRHILISVQQTEGYVVQLLLSFSRLKSSHILLGKLFPKCLISFSLGHLVSSSKKYCECACTDEKDSGMLNVCCNSPKTMQMSAG